MPLRGIIRTLVGTGAGLLLALDGLAAEPATPIELTVKYYYPGGAGVSLAEQAQNAVLAQFYKDNPNVRLKPWSSLQLPGDMFQQAELLAFAGGIAADIVPLFFHQVQFYTQQGLLAPLNEFIGEDTNGDGVLTDDEIRWKPWLEFPLSFRRACMIGTTIYAVPLNCYSGGYLFRRDLFQTAGLNPDQPPQTLEEWWRACQRLTIPARNGESGQWALSMGDLPFHGFFFACGANLVGVEWLDTGGAVMAHSRLEDDPAPYIRRSLKPRYRAVFDSPEAVQALEWMWKFRWQPWVRDPQTGEIRDLTEAEAAHTPGVIRGILHSAETSKVQGDPLSLFKRGVLAMANITIGPRAGENPPANAGLLAFPALRAGDPPPTFVLPMTLGINSAIRDAQKRQAAWRWVSYRAGGETARIENELYAQNGMLQAISTRELHRAGMMRELAELPQQWRTAQERIFFTDRVLPFVNGWLPIEQEIIAGITKPMLDDPQFDYRQALHAVCRRANEKVFGDLPPATRKHREHGALLALALTVVLLLVGGTVIVRNQIQQARAAALRNLGSRGVHRREILIAALLLVPAIGLILLFQYYPVARGSLMAFEDYRLIGEARWAGLDNFVEGLFASRLALAAVNTIVFVLLSLGLGFIAPIGLALLLTEIPRGTAVYRTIYYLPAVTAGLVVVLLWMRLYEPNELGVLNQLLHPFINGWNGLVPTSWQIGWPIRWLQDSKWAMVATILPSVWAGAGPGCLIYLAALKSIPEEFYEAADLDGAGLWGKIRHITIPGIGPLILINFVGAFIGTFHSMGNIFVMTGGGPNYATHVVALEIWQNAFLYLRFGVATAQAWMVAAALIGFVILQLRIMSRLDWRQAGR